jgi:hypothetical protein
MFFCGYLVSAILYKPTVGLYNMQEIGECKKKARGLSRAFFYCSDREHDTALQMSDPSLSQVAMKVLRTIPSPHSAVASQEPSRAPRFVGKDFGVPSQAMGWPHQVQEMAWPS